MLTNFSVDPRSFYSDPVTNCIRISNGCTTKQLTIARRMDGEILHMRLTIPAGTKAPVIKKTSIPGVFVMALSAMEDRCVVCRNNHYYLATGSPVDVSHRIAECDFTYPVTVEEVLKWLYNIVPGEIRAANPSVIGVTSYEPPYTEEDMIIRGYSSELIDKLKADPAHSWRMMTGIELIHQEPTRDELVRIWSNWQMMPDDLKKVSDLKCMELFGCNNETHYTRLITQYITKG